MILIPMSISEPCASLCNYLIPLAGKGLHAQHIRMCGSSTGLRPGGWLGWGRFGHSLRVLPEAESRNSTSLGGRGHGG